MENVFEKLGEMLRPESLPKYMVKTETKGTLYFDDLPLNTYFLEGSRDEADKGKAMYFTNDNGTCLIPIIETATGQQVCDISRAGTEIK